MLLQALLAALLATALLVAAGLKAADRTNTAVAAGTFGLHGRAARSVWLPLAALEALLAAGLLAGWRPAAAAAAVVLAAFALAQALAIAAGRGGAPCGCFGTHGRVSGGSVARTAALAAAGALLAGLGPAALSSPARLGMAGSILLAASLLVARAHRAGAPEGALEVASEGPPLGARLDLGTPPPRLALFISPTCRLCRALQQPARELGATLYDEHEDAAAWATAGVPGAPYAIALAADGTVLAKGTVNTRRQLASVLAAGKERSGTRAETPQPTRRHFIATAGAAVGVLTAARTLTVLVKPGDAEAFHFCGHIFTTDGCPHPTGLPRIDSRGYPLRARDGRRIDDLGRPIADDGSPVREDGTPLLDPDGRPIPPATRTRVCSAAGRRFDIKTRTDGAWFRCCNGHVRKLSDCCTTDSRRINGDAALRGYCYGKHRVFCVMYFQTRVPC